MNKAQELLLECFEAKFNMDLNTKIKNMKDDFLGRLVGISSSDAKEFRMELQKFLDDRTQFQTLNKALMAFLPIWRGKHPSPDDVRVAA